MNPAEMRRTAVFSVADPSGVGQARRGAMELGRALGFAEASLGKAALVATELAGNLVKHAGGGRLLLRPLACGEARGLEILALDRGPGIADLRESLRDGFSTAGSPGTGLGAVYRLSSLFDIYAEPGSGTAVLSRLWAGQPPSNRQGKPMETGALAVSLKEGEPCGDAWSVIQLPGRVLFLMADGLGHGHFAAQASAQAVQTFEEHPSDGPAEMMERLHLSLKNTRGAAAATVEVRLETQTLRFCGVGNIAAAILSPGARRNLPSHNGTLGHEAYKIREYGYPFEKKAGQWPLILMHSDGLSARWSLEDRPALLSRHPALIAGWLYRDHCRGQDDAAVLIGRVKG